MSGLFCNWEKFLYRDNVLGLGTFLACCNGELDLLTICKGLESITFYGAEMKEHIWHTFLPYETETLCLVEPLNGTCNCRNTILPII